MKNFSENKRLATNTILLYLRTFIVLLISLYSSRIILQALGVEDFGIYNVIGSIIILFSFLNTAMVSATQRFLNYELGRGNLDQLSRIFSVSMSLYICIIFIFLLFAETLGLWFLNNKMNFPASKLLVANIVYQFSLVTFSLNLLRVPYNAVILAHERMSLFAYISIVESVLKLIVAFSLFLILNDRLIFYAFLVLCISLIILFIYRFFCVKYYESVSKYSFIYDKQLILKIASFSGYMLFSSSASIAGQQGINIFLNIFRGVIYNAAMGIANQVSAAMNNITNSFQVSYQPQIVKYYAQNNLNKVYSLTFFASRVSFLLISLIGFPLIFNMDLILSIWLGKVPSYTSIFCQLIIISSMIDAITASYNIVIQATGRIKAYTLFLTFSFIQEPIFVFFILKYGYSPSYILLARIFFRGLVNMIIGLFFLQKLTDFPVFKYFREVLCKIIVIILIVLPIPLYFQLNIDDLWYRLLFTSLGFFLVALPSFFFLGLHHNERSFIIQKLKK